MRCASSNLAISSRKAVAPTGRPLFCICWHSNWRPPFERAPASGYRLSGLEHLPPVSVLFRHFLSRLTCWASAQRRSLGAKNCSKNASSQVLRSFHGDVFGRGKAQTAGNTFVFSRSGTKLRPKTARENRQGFESTKPKHHSVSASALCAVPVRDGA